jgi:FAD synthetase
VGSRNYLRNSDYDALTQPDDHIPLSPCRTMQQDAPCAPGPLTSQTLPIDRSVHSQGIPNGHNVDQMTDAVSVPAPSQSLEDVCKGLHNRIESFLSEETHDDILVRTQKQTRIALGVIEEAFERFTLEQLCFSYNGGKDCLVLLILYLAGLYAHLRPNTDKKNENGTKNAAQKSGQGQAWDSIPHSDVNTEANGNASLSTANPAAPKRDTQPPFPTQLTSIYIQTPHPFPEVTEFVESSSAHYHLNLVESALPMKAAFEEYLNEHKSVKAIFVGTRRTDPHGGNLTFFDMTDRGWPEFMRYAFFMLRLSGCSMPSVTSRSANSTLCRIHPVIDWHYREIWAVSPIAEHDSNSPLIVRLI